MLRDGAVALHADPVGGIRGRDRERVGPDHRHLRPGQRHADREMLARAVRELPGPVVRCQVEGPDGAALVDDLRHPERPPPRRAPGRPDAVGGLRPVAGHQRVRRPAVRPERPAQRQGAAPADHPARPEGPEPLGALERGDLGRIQDHRGVAGQLQEIARLEIGEDQAGPAVQEDVPEGGEEQVAGEVGDGQRAVRGDADEPRLAAAMRDVDLAPALAVGVGGHEERVGRRDQGARRRVELGALLGGDRDGDARLAHEGHVAQLDVLRAVPEALIDVEVQDPAVR